MSVATSNQNLCIYFYPHVDRVKDTIETVLSKSRWNSHNLMIMYFGLAITYHIFQLCLTGMFHYLHVFRANKNIFGVKKVC